MLWLLTIGLGLVIVFLVLVWVLGGRLPQAHRAVVSARYTQSPAQVWATITNMLMAPNWRSGVRQIERLPDRDGRHVWVEVGRRRRLPLEFEVVEPERHLISHIHGEHLPFGGSWTYELEPDADGCRLTLTEQGEIYSPALRFFAHHVFGYDANMRRYLEDLGKKFGAKVTPERRG